MKHDPEPPMPPPQIQATLSAHMLDSFARLKQQADVAAAAEPVLLHPTANAPQTRQDRRCTDFAVLVREWYQSIPPAARNRRFTADELVHRFAGRYRDRPALRMIAAALRANGFTQHRDWSAQGRNQRYWLGPKT